MPLSSDAKTHIVVSADTSKARKEIEKLAATNKRTAKETSDAQKKVSDSLEKQIAVIGKVAGGVLAAAAAYQTASAAIDKFQRYSQLSSAAATKDIDAIVAASGGLLTKMQALELAAQASNSAFKSNQAEIELMAKLFRKLVRGGNDVERSFDGIKTAIVEANTEGLKQLGVQIKAESDTMRGYTQLMEGAIEKTKDLGSASENTAESIQKAKSNWANAMDDLQKAFGELATKLEPVAVLITKMVSGLAELIGFFIADTSGKSAMEQLKAAKAKRARAAEVIKNIEAAGIPQPHEGGAILTYEQAQRDIKYLDNLIDGLEKLARVKKKAEVRTSLVFGPDDETNAEKYKRLTDEIRKRTEALKEQKALEEEYDRKFRSFGTGITGATRRLEKNPLGVGFAGIPGRSQTVLMEEQIGQQAKALRDSLPDVTEELKNGLLESTSVMQQSFHAMIMGTKGVKEAFRDMVAGILESLSNKMLAYSISEFVEALVNPADAPRHLVAAAKAGAAAVAIGTMARKVGGSQHTGSPSGAAGAVGSSRAPISRGSNVTVYVGADFADNPRANADKLRRAWDKTRVYGGDDQVIVRQ